MILRQMARFCLFGALVSLVGCGSALGAAPTTVPARPISSFVDVFVAGQEGYHTYRIPSLLLTAKGTLLAFAEGRKNGRGDSGQIDLVIKRSVDGGRTWSGLAVGAAEGPNTIGHARPGVGGDAG